MIAATVIIVVMLAGAPPAPPHFDTEIIPVLTRAGCNAGSCHGAAAGRGGFHLSLFGGDPASDYEAIVHAFEGRRVNLARPDESLVLLKPTGQSKHGGGLVLPEDGAGAERLRNWIAAGAPRGSPRRLTHFAASASRAVVDDEGTKLPLQAVARFDNGPEVNVTQWTVFNSSDPAGLAIDEAVATVLRRGQHDLVARFLDRVEPIRITLPLRDSPVDLSDEPRANLIDEEIIDTLAALRIPVSGQADDATFLRRLRLDLTGTLPAPDEVEAFLKDDSADRREKLVDRLLASEDFADYWTLRFSRLLRVHSLPNEKEGMRAYTAWLRQSLRDNMPLDRWARALLTATGDSHEVGPANFARTVADARGQAELVSRVFLGARMQCANCHNHPLDRWTQDDYHGLAAVFAKLERGRVVKVGARGVVTNPRTGEPAVPRIPGTRFIDHPDPMAAFAGWVAAKDNPYFAQAMVNRLWRAMFGRGLVEPVDDLRSTNPATHPRLLDRLAWDFTQNGYDLRRTLKLIALSRAYGRSAKAVPGNEADDRYYSRSYRRPLEPEVLADAIAAVTGVPEDYPGLPKGTRAITLYDPVTPAPSLDVLGRCSRVAGCEENAQGGGLPAKLHLLNGELLNAKIIAKEGRLAKLIAAGRSDREIVTEFYLRGFGRRPSEKELTGWLDRIVKAGPDTRLECLEDLLWSLLNSREFTTNH